MFLRRLLGEQKNKNRNTGRIVHQRPTSARPTRAALVALLAVGLLPVSGLSRAADLVQPTGCILDQPHAPVNDLNCTADDIELANPTVIPIDQCDFPGDTVTVDLSVEIINNANDRYDIGVWMSTDGDPNADGSYTGTCAAASLPAPSQPASDHTDDGDMCGDVSKVAADPDLPTTSLGLVTLLCVDDDGDGFLDVPVTTVWKNMSENNCADSTFAMPETKSKCSNIQTNIPVPIPGQIIVIKETVPIGDPKWFDFHIDGPAGVANQGDPFPGAADFQLNGIAPTDTWDSNQYAGGLVSGTYAVSEAPADGWATEVVCSSNKGGDISPDAIDLRHAEVVTCTYTNTKQQTSTGVYLLKLWKNGITDDRVDLLLGGVEQIITQGSDQVGGSRSAAISVATAGNTVTFDEVFDPDVSARYATEFACSSSENVPGYISGETSATLEIGENDADRIILCTFLNTQVDTRITLSKVWNNGQAGDSVELGILGGSGSVPGEDGFSTAPNTTTDATATALAGDVIILAERFTSGQSANYGTTLECTGATNEVQHTFGRREGKLTIVEEDIGKDIHCTFVNARRSAQVILQKTWEYGRIGDTSELSLEGLESQASSSAISTVLTGMDVEEDTINLAEIITYEGETVTLNETLGPDGALYDSELSCNDLLGLDPIQGTSGSIVVPSGLPGLLPITCTFTNTRKTASLRLAKSWVNAFVGDKVDAQTTGLTNDASLSSEANTPAEIDNGVAVTVYAGETAILSDETFTPPGSAANYSNQGWVCDGADQTPGDGITIDPGDEGKEITCTIENTRNETTFTLNKVWANARGGDVVKLDAEGSDTSGEVIATSSTAPAGSGASMRVLAGETVTFSETFSDALHTSDYTVAWECTDGTTTSNGTTLSDNTWVVGADPAPINCTFTNTGVPGQIIVTKETVPTGDSTDFNFQIVGPEGDANLGNPFPGSVDFSLNGLSPTTWDSAQYDGGLLPGQYQVSEDPVVGWQTEVICISSMGGDVNPGAIDLRLAELVTCTFTNTDVSVGVNLIKLWKNGIAGDKVMLTLGGDVLDSTDGSSQAGGPATAATSTSLVGGTVIFEEVFDPDAGDSIKYSTQFECTSSENQPVYVPGERTASLVIGESDIGRDILCFFQNTQADTRVTLSKSWIEAEPGDSVELKIGGGSGSAPAMDGSSTAPDNTTAATSTALVGNVLRLVENFTNGQSANYEIDLSCTGATNEVQYTPGQLTGELTIDEEDLGKDIHCTFTNTRKTASLRLAKSWVNAFVSDKVDAQTSGLSNDAILNSEANIPTEIDYGDEVTVYVGETAILTDEIFTPPESAENYTHQGWVCDGVDQTPGDGITIEPGDEGKQITCTIENTRKTVDVLLQKIWEYGQIGDTAALNLASLESLINATATSTVLTGVASEPDTLNTAIMTAFSGEVVDLTETLSPDGSLYSSELSCDGLLDPDPMGGTSGSFIVPADLAGTPKPETPITCTFTNKRRTATLRLAKSWVNAFVTDKIDAQTSGLGNYATLHSEANVPTEIDYGDAITVYVGETAILSDEKFTPFSAAETYTNNGWVCDGVDQTPDDGITIEPGDEGNQITCTIENTRKSTELRLYKDWVNAAPADMVELSIDATNDDLDVPADAGAGGSLTSADYASITVYAGETVSFSEVFGTNTGRYDVTNFSCEGAENDPIWNGAPTDTSATLDVTAADIDASVDGDPITCTFENTRQRTTVELTKTWENGRLEDTAVLTLDGLESLETSSATSTVLMGAASEPDDTNVARILAYVGETVTLAETLSMPDDYAYQLSCVPEILAENPSLDVTNGSFVVPEGSAGGTITCTFTNIRRSTELRLYKDWVNAAQGDSVDLSIDATNDDGPVTSAAAGGTGPADAYASITVYAGEAVSFEEVFGVNIGIYDVTNFSCEGATPTWNGEPTDTTATLYVTAADVETLDPIACTFENTRVEVEVFLRKQWFDAKEDDTSTLFVAGQESNRTDDATSTASGVEGSELDDDPAHIASIMAYTGEIVDLLEVLDGPPENYNITLSCDGENEADDREDGTGSIDVDSKDISLTCTFTNTRKSNEMEIWKEWINAIEEDVVEITGTSSLDNSTNTSEAESIDFSDPAVVTILVYAGDDVPMSEEWVGGIGSANNYITSLDCGDVVGELTYTQEELNGSLKIDAADTQGDDPIVCTFTNTGRPAELTLIKEVVLGDYYTFHDDEFTLMANEGASSPISGTSGSDDVTDVEVTRDVYHLEEEDAPEFDWLTGLYAIPAGGWDCVADVGGEFKGSITDIPNPDDNPQIIGDEILLGEGELTILPGDDTVCTVINEELPPIPVTLSYAKVSNDPASSHTLFEWETVVEVNNAGFALYYEDVDERWQPVDGGAFVVSKGAGTTVQRYRYEARSAIDAQRFSLSDLNGYGGQRVHGPFELNEVFGSRTDEQKIDWDSINRENEATQDDDLSEVEALGD